MKNLFSKILIIGVPLLLALGCRKKAPDYPVIPSIEYKGIQRNSDGSIVKKYYFRDGDADVGFPSSEIHSFYFTIYVKNGMAWDSVGASDYPVPFMEDVTHRKVYEGEIDVNIPAPAIEPPATKYRCYLIDRAGHRSNTVETPELVP
jgi:hypothetical protein